MKSETKIWKLDEKSRGEDKEEVTVSHRMCFSHSDALPQRVLFLWENAFWDTVVFVA